MTITFLFLVCAFNILYSVLENSLQAKYCFETIYIRNLFSLAIHVSRLFRLNFRCNFLTRLSLLEAENKGWNLKKKNYEIILDLLRTVLAE